CRTGIDEPVDPLAREQLAAFTVALDRTVSAARRDLRRTVAQLGYEGLHPRVPALEFVRPLHMRLEQRHAAIIVLWRGAACRRRRRPRGFAAWPSALLTMSE